MGVNSEAGYRLVEHTADAGLVAWGPNPAQAFAQATRGMFEIVLGADPQALPEPGESHTLEAEVQGQTWDDLLVNWLAELVFWFDVDGFVPRQVAFDECAPPRCAARLLGTRLEDSDEAGGVCIKAVTYHQLSVNVAPERTELRVIFDI